MFDCSIDCGNSGRCDQQHYRVSILDGCLVSSIRLGLVSEIELHKFPDYKLSDRGKTRFDLIVLELKVGPFLAGS